MTCNEKYCPFTEICSFYSFIDDNKENCKYENNIYEKLKTIGFQENRWRLCKEETPPINTPLLVKRGNYYFVGEYANKVKNEYYFWSPIDNCSYIHRNFETGVAWKYVE